MVFLITGEKLSKEKVFALLSYCLMVLFSLFHKKEEVLENFSVFKWLKCLFLSSGLVDAYQANVPQAD